MALPLAHHPRYLGDQPRKVPKLTPCSANASSRISIAKEALLAFTPNKWSADLCPLQLVRWCCHLASRPRSSLVVGASSYTNMPRDQPRQKGQGDYSGQYGRRKAHGTSGVWCPDCDLCYKDRDDGHALDGHLAEARRLNVRYRCPGYHHTSCTAIILRNHLAACQAYHAEQMRPGSLWAAFIGNNLQAAKQAQELKVDVVPPAIYLPAPMVFNPQIAGTLASAPSMMPQGQAQGKMPPPNDVAYSASGFGPPLAGYGTTSSDVQFHQDPSAFSSTPQTAQASLSPTIGGPMTRPVNQPLLFPLAQAAYLTNPQVNRSLPHAATGYVGLPPVQNSLSPNVGNQPAQVTQPSGTYRGMNANLVLGSGHLSRTSMCGSNGARGKSLLGIIKKRAYAAEEEDTERSRPHKAKGSVFTPFPGSLPQPVEPLQAPEERRGLGSALLSGGQRNDGRPWAGEELEYGGGPWTGRQQWTGTPQQALSSDQESSKTGTPQLSSGFESPASASTIGTPRPSSLSLSVSASLPPLSGLLGAQQTTVAEWNGICFCTLVDGQHEPVCPLSAFNFARGY